MMRIVYVLKRASLQICILVVSVVACQIASRLVADQVTSAGPRIADVRVGLMNHYKLGCWTPVSVDVTGVTNAEMAKNLRIDVTVADSDGVNTTASAPVSLQSDQDGRWSAVVYTQVGRVGSPIQVSLLNKDNPIDDRTLLPSATSNSEAAVFPISATSELIVFLGKSPNGIKGAFPDRTASGSQIGRKLLKINSTAALPKHWFGYDGVDVLVMSVADGQLCRELAADKVRFAALQRWVNLGGRLVVLCNGKKAQAMIGAGGPLSSFAPGKFVEVVPLRDTGPLEHFANSATINGTTIEVPRLTDVKGNIDVYAGRRPADLPLVVRSARGFGEITFVGVESEEPPLSAWSGRNAFLQALLRPYLPDSEVSDSTQKLVASGFNDLSGALRQQLGRKFKLLMPVGFPIVAALAIAYLFVLGPVDYLFIHRWIRRPWVAWISFPVVVAGFAAIALAFGNWSRGAAGPRVNQLVLVDYDTIGRQARHLLVDCLQSDCEPVQFEGTAGAEYG